MSIAYVFVGVLTGIVSGLLGIGGASVMIPLFVFWFGLSQHQAQGTSLAAMLAPVFLLAVLRYHQEGHVNIPIAILVAVGVTVGGLIGAHFAQMVPEAALKRLFGIYLIAIGIRMTFFR